MAASLVLDTNVLIYHLNGEQKVVQQLTQWREEQVFLLISTIVEIELLSLPSLSTRDIEVIDELLATLHVVEVDSVLSRAAASVRRKRRLKLADSIVAATALA